MTGGGGSTATVVGFGGRAPEEVLSLLAKAVSTGLVSTIVPIRSRSIETELLRAPHRTFLRNEPSSSSASQKEKKSSSAAVDLVLYLLPTSVTECVSAGSESSSIRTKLIASASASGGNDGEPTEVVVTYDASTNSFLGVSSRDDVLAALLSSDDDDDDGPPSSSAASVRSSLALAGLTALSNLDRRVASTLSSSSSSSSEKQRRSPGGDVVIVVGSGGREHALAFAVAKSPLVASVVCCPGNGGTASETTAGGGKIRNAAGVNGKQDNDTVLKLIEREGADMVVVGPEAPLVDGLVDAIKEKFPEVKAFGPTRAAAELEASKAFSKDFMKEHSIPTASYRTFTSHSEAVSYVESLSETDRVVVKASGLAAGKGVLLPNTKSETLSAVKEIMLDRAFGAAGDSCVIERCLSGPEASCLAFCDGETAVLLPAAQDHKRALDDDGGLNTGGMGAYAPAPCVTPKLQSEIEELCRKTVREMKGRGTPYVGCLYAGMMLTDEGPSVLEYNVRFGDPETQVVLPLLETDLYEIFVACCDGTLSDVDVRFKENSHAATVVCAAKGYPEKYPKGMRINGLNEAGKIEGAKVYHAGTKIDGEGGGATTRCSGGRVLAVTGVGSTLDDALKSSYRGVSELSFVDDETGDKLMHHRTDIAKGAANPKLRIGVLGSTRGTSLLPVMEACADGSIHAEIVAVLSNRSKAPILDKGRSLGINVTTKFVSSKGLTREEYDAECTSVLLDAGVEYVLLVGYMRILSKAFTDFWEGRCINVHPSLLPKHAGGMDLEVHRAVLDAGESVSGCTIHRVTEAVDGGPIVVQKVVKVESGETPESLKAKVQAEEGKAFVEAIEKHVRGDKTSVLRYADAGVSVDEGNRLVDLIKPACKSTKRPGCDASLGGFGGLFDLSAAGYDPKDTVLIGATDGVGTKLLVARSTGKHDTVGIDLVAMCVNDIIVAGGEPLFFLDYYATGKLDVSSAAGVVGGIAEGCRRAGCGLIGGETAEMPSMYGDGEYDLAGFAVGAVGKDDVLPKDDAEVGDVLLGLPSSGLHSNGFSLVRKLLKRERLSYGDPCPWDPDAPSVGDSLLTPTKIYVKACLPLLKAKVLRGMAHITGGGLLENLPRVLPDDNGIVAEISDHPPLPPVFRWMKRSSKLDDAEMLRTFNCGVGMVLIVKKGRADEAKELLKEAGEDVVFDLGVLVEGGGAEGDERVVVKSPLS